jgi:DNA-binding transcriptional LysR family regulator
LDPRLEIRHLRYFVTVAETLHFGKAAKALYISQPPLSRQIRDLESWVGVPLLDRSSKSIALTKAGAIFLQEAKRILKDLSQSVHMARRAAAGELDRVAIAFDPFFDCAIMTGIRDAFAASHPDVQLTFHRVDSHEQAALIQGGSLDAGLLILPAADGDRLTREPLFREPAVAMVYASHPLSSRSEVSVRDLARFPVLEICHNFGDPFYGHATRIGTMCGVPLRAERTCSGFERVAHMLRDSKSLALLPAGVRELCGDGIHCIPVNDRGADFTFGLVYDRARVSSALARIIELARRINETQPQHQKSGMAAA